MARRHDRYAHLVGVSFDWHQRAPSRRASSPSTGVNRFLIEHLAPASYAVEGDFDRLPIPFRAVATDLGTGELRRAREGRPGAGGAGQHVDPAVLPAGRLGGPQARRRPDREQPARSTSRRPSTRRSPSRSTSAARRSTPEDYAACARGREPGQQPPERPAHQDFTADADVLIRPDLGEHSATEYSNFDALIKAGYEATQAGRAADPGEARRRVRHRPVAARLARAVPGARGNEDRRGGDARQRACLRMAAAAHLQHPGRAAVRDGPRAARVRQGRRDRAARARLDRVRVGAGGPSHRAALAGRGAEPRGDRRRLQRVGEGSRLARAAQPEHARVRGAARAPARRERRRDAGAGDDARRAAGHRRHGLPGLRLHVHRQAALLRRRTATSSTAPSSSARA